MQHLCDFLLFWPSTGDKLIKIANKHGHKTEGQEQDLIKAEEEETDHHHGEACIQSKVHHDVLSHLKLGLSVHS